MQFLFVVGAGRGLLCNILLRTLTHVWKPLSHVMFVQGSVGTSLVMSFGWLWVCGGFLKFLGRSCNLVQPFLLREFLKSVSSTALNARLISLFWVQAMSVCALADTFLGSQSDIRLDTVRLCMRQALRQFLYAKALALSLQSKARFGMGTLTNLLSNDTPKIIGWAVYGHSLWSAPFQASPPHDLHPYAIEKS